MIREIYIPPRFCENREYAARYEAHRRARPLRKKLRIWWRTR